MNDHLSSLDSELCSNACSIESGGNAVLNGHDNQRKTQAKGITKNSRGKEQASVNQAEQIALKELLDILQKPYQDVCPQCSGSGKVAKVECISCKGSGHRLLKLL